jgi:hypothetical protein
MARKHVTTPLDHPCAGAADQLVRRMLAAIEYARVRPPTGIRLTHSDCLILTTGHHRDDARLNRHVAALENAGIVTTLVAIPTTRYMRLIAAPALVYRCLRTVRPKAVIFPDPELFVAGPLVAKWMGVRSVLDVHEDYGAVAL